MTLTTDCDNESFEMLFLPFVQQSQPLECHKAVDFAGDWAMLKHEPAAKCVSTINGCIGSREHVFCCRFFHLVDLFLFLFFFAGSRKLHLSMCIRCVGLGAGFKYIARHLQRANLFSWQLHRKPVPCFQSPDGPTQFQNEIISKKPNSTAECANKRKSVEET